MMMTPMVVVPTGLMVPPPPMVVMSTHVMMMATPVMMMLYLKSCVHLSRGVLNRRGATNRHCKRRGRGKGEGAMTKSLIAKKAGTPRNPRRSQAQTAPGASGRDYLDARCPSGSRKVDVSEVRAALRACSRPEPSASTGSPAEKLKSEYGAKRRHF